MSTEKPKVGDMWVASNRDGSKCTLWVTEIEPDHIGVLIYNEKQHRKLVPWCIGSLDAFIHRSDWDNPWKKVNLDEP